MSSEPRMQYTRTESSPTLDVGFRSGFAVRYPLGGFASLYNYVAVRQAEIVGHHVTVTGSGWNDRFAAQSGHMDFFTGESKFL